MQHNTVCKTCKRESKRFEALNYIQVNVVKDHDGKKTVEAGLAELTKPIQFVGANQYT